MDIRRLRRATRWRRARRLAPALVAVLSLATLTATACARSPAQGGDPSPAADVTALPNADTDFPVTNWATVNPTDAGFDPAVLDDIAADAQQAGSNCFVVVRHGRLVASWYWNGTDAGTTQPVFSITKSLASTLVGIAQDEGFLAIDDRASKYIPAWVGTASENVTIADLLSNDSGRHWEVGTDYGGLLQASDRTSFATGLEQDGPAGTTWVYNNAAVQTLEAILSVATGSEPETLAQDELLGPIGMTHSGMTRDGASNTNLFFGLHSTCEDMARFGLLFLEHGNWDDTQVVPGDWVDAAVGDSSQDMNAAYGLLWWLNRKGSIVADPLRAITADEAMRAPPGQLVPGAPEDMYWALGLGGQVIQVDPGSDTVVVRLGPVSQPRDRYGPRQTARVVMEALISP